MNEDLVMPDANSRGRLKAVVDECKFLQSYKVSKEFSTPSLEKPSHFKYVITIEGLTSERQMPPDLAGLDPGYEVLTAYENPTKSKEIG